MQAEKFGEVDGVDILQVTLRSAAGATAKVISWGAVLQDMTVPGATGPQRVVLGLNSLSDYRQYSPHFGATPGRFANRIAGGRFDLDGKSYQLPLNEKGRNTLHGGPNGFGKRPWQLTAADGNSATLVLDSPDGDAGFPGALRLTCIYALLEPATLLVELTATCDAPTIVNLANHSYFNLDGSPDILDHRVTLNAGFRTPTDAELIPTGEILAVEGTPYDFCGERTVRNPSGTTYDTNFVITAEPDWRTGLAHAASVKSLRSGLTLELHTNQPGIQFYDAAKLNCPVPGLGGAHYGPHAGLCLEAQNFPDAPNHRHFPSSVLRPGQRYHQRSEYRFS